MRRGLAVIIGTAAVAAVAVVALRPKREPDQAAPTPPYPAFDYLHSELRPSDLRSVRDVPLYWLGTSFHGLPLHGISRAEDSGAVLFHYGSGRDREDAERAADALRGANNGVRAGESLPPPATLRCLQLG